MYFACNDLPNVILILSTVVLNFCNLSFTDNPGSQQGYRLNHNFNYLAVAPKLVRPDQPYNVYVTVYSMQVGSMFVRATLSASNEEYATSMVQFDQTGTKEIQMRIPHVTYAANHTLSLEGLMSTASSEPVFRNVTTVYYEQKHVSIFVTTDQPLYYAGQTVQFRVVGMTRTHQAANGDITIYVKDAKNTVVRRFLQRQLNIGIYTDSFILPYPVNIGEWNIIVNAFGEQYTQSFLVKFYYQRRFDVIIKAPLYIGENYWGISGTIEGEHTSSASIEGNVTVSARVRYADGSLSENHLNLTIPYINGIESFSFPMEKLRATFGPVAGHDIFMKAWMYDFFWQETINGTAVTQIVKDEVKVNALGKKFRTFKPGTPFTVNFAVAHGHGSQYKANKYRNIVVVVIHIGDAPTTTTEERVVIPDDSVVRYTVTPSKTDKHITVRAWHELTMQVTEIECYRYWSNQNKYLAITTSTDSATIESYMVFTLRANFHPGEVNFLIMATGGILVGGTLTMTSIQKTFGVALSRDMAPAARIFVYCVEKGEVLTDSLTFYVKDTALLNASLTINYGKDFRGDKIELIGRANPGGYISLNGYHRDLYERGGNTFIDEDKVTAELLQFNRGSRPDIDQPQHNIWYDVDGLWQKSVYFNEPSTGIDHITTFNVSGLVVLSDTNITVPEQHSQCNSTLGFGRCLNGDCYELIYACNGVVDCVQDGYDEMGCSNNAYVPVPRPHRLDDLHLVDRHFPPNDWTWSRIYVKHTGQTEILLTVPDIDREFMIHAFTEHPDTGLAVLERPLLFDTTRLFTMNVEAVPRLRRGEQLGIRCTLFNYWDQELEVIAMLHGSTDYRFIAVEEFGIVSSYSPRTVTGDIQVMVHLPAKSFRYLHFPVLPMINSGEITVVISAFSILRLDVEERTIEVAYEGVLNDDQTPYMVDLVNQGSLIIPDFDIVMPERFFVPGERELLYVPGSNTATMFIWGDVVSPGFFEDYLTTEVMAAVPMDSADGYVFDFAINLQTLQFLHGTNGLDQEKAAKAIDFMQSIIPRAFAYMQDDGSFKMFRRAPNPCLWLTSWILRVFHEAQASQWFEELYIDIDTLNKVAGWIVDQYNPTKMRWEETSDVVYDRNMQAETLDHNNTTQDLHIAVTAHVIITLSGVTRLTGGIRGKIDTVVREACEYLVDHMYSLANPFHVAMVAYALHKANHGKKDEAYILLKAMRRETEHVYWCINEIEPNPTTIVNNRVIILGRTDYMNEGNCMIATSYALLLYLAHNEWETSRPILKWLHTQHNDVHTHSSTQDTLIALQAMTQCAFRETNREFYQMEITLTATKPTEPVWQHTVLINNTNFMERFEFTLDEAWGYIRASARGTGYAMMHLSAFHHVEHEKYVNNPEYDAPFEFYLADQFFYGRNASFGRMTACARLLRPELTPRTGMMFILMEIPTGYYISRDTIEWMYASGVSGLKRVQFRNQILIMFFDYIRHEVPTCVTTRIDRWYPVANVSIAYLVNVFEYSETALQNNFLYKTYTLFHLHLCQVCGSFQCPYCPFYNTAPNLVTSKTLLSLWLLYTIVTFHRTVDTFVSEHG